MKKLMRNSRGDIGFVLYLLLALLVIVVAFLIVPKILSTFEIIRVFLGGQKQCGGSTRDVLERDLASYIKQERLSDAVESYATIKDCYHEVNLPAESDWFTHYIGMRDTTLDVRKRIEHSLALYKLGKKKVFFQEALGNIFSLSSSLKSPSPEDKKQFVAFLDEFLFTYGNTADISPERISSAYMLSGKTHFDLEEYELSRARYTAFIQRFGQKSNQRKNVIEAFARILRMYMNENNYSETIPILDQITNFGLKSNELNEFPYGRDIQNVKIEVCSKYQDHLTEAPLVCTSSFTPSERKKCDSGQYCKTLKPSCPSGQRWGMDFNYYEEVSGSFTGYPKTDFPYCLQCCVYDFSADQIKAMESYFGALQLPKT